MVVVDLIEKVRAVADRVAGSTGWRSSTCSSAARPAAWCFASGSIDQDLRRTAEDSVSVDDCARVSRDLSAMLDVEDIVPTRIHVGGFVARVSTVRFAT